MAADALASLLRLRRIELDRARRTLADCLAAERQAEALVRESLRRIEAERNRATGSDPGGPEYASFARWLPHARQAMEDAAAERSRLAAQSALARAALAGCRAGSRAADQMAARRRAATDARLALGAQHALEDASRRRPATGGSDGSMPDETGGRTVVAP